MFQLLFDRHHNVLRTRLHGTYVEADITLRDKAVARFVALHGPARGIMDFSDVQAVEVTIDSVVRRSAGPALLEGQVRVIVAPREPLWALNRIFAAHQLYRRGTEPILVRSLAEAYRALAIETPAFELLEMDDASRRESVAASVLAGIARARGATEAEERERTRRKMLQLLDTVLAKPPPRQEQAITLSDVLNAALGGATVSDADLKAICSGCGSRKTLASCTLSAGRETTYACPSCGHVLVVLSPLDDGAAGPAPAGYELGRFIVRTSGDIECPGALLPKCEP